MTRKRLLTTVMAGFITFNMGGSEHGFPEFTFKKRRVGEASKFSDEKKLDDALNRLLRVCANSHNRGVPKESVIDAARFLVKANDRYKAQANSVQLVFLDYPWARDSALFVGGTVTGALGFWMLT